MLERLKTPLAALAACAALVGCAQDDSTRLKSVAGLLPDLAFTLTDDAGRAVTARDYRGDTILLFFGFTNCPDVCPTTLARLAEAVRDTRSRGKGMRVLFVTVDPARDTTARLQEYVRAFGPEFVGLRGTPEALQELAKRYRIAYSLGKPDAKGQYDVTHSSGVFVFDRSGRVRYLILPEDPAPAISEALDLLAAESGESASARPAVVATASRVPAREAREDASRSVAATPRLSPVEGKAQPRTLRLVLAPGDTLLGALARAGIPSGEAYAATQALSALVDPRSLKAKQEINLSLRTDGEVAKASHLESLVLVPATDRLVVVRRRDDDRFVAQAQAIEHSPRLVLARGEIGSSFYEAARERDVPTPVLLQAYRTLNHAVDFQRDIRDGDAFALGYESFDDGEYGARHSGDLRYASLTLAGRTLEVYRHATDDGDAGFFDADGRSVKTSLMKTPVDGARLSSLFGKRDHPILGYSRMHKGLDFAAPRGAPVLAAGDGTIVRRSRNGSFGNYIRIRHDRAYATAYAHLSRYAKGLMPGDRVRQGEVIGYVGATGLATGPNLHYEVLADGDPVNPVTLNLPPRRVLTGDELARFQRAKANLLELLETAPAAKRGRSDQ